jgi:hypothetical protein
VSLGPNDLLPCPSETAKRRHLIRAERCRTCGTEGRWMPLPTLDDLIAERRRLREVLDRGAA